MSSPTPVYFAPAPRTPNARETPFGKRVVKANPLLHGRDDDRRDTRRKLFLKKVREDSGEKRWQRRMEGGEEEMMRTIWIAEQRRRAERQARDARGWDVDVVDEEGESLQESGQFVFFWDSASRANKAIDEMLLDEVAQKEEEELEALIALITEEKRSRAASAGHNVSAASSTVAQCGDVLSSGDSQMSDTGPSGYSQAGTSMEVQRRNTRSPDTAFGSDEGEYDDIFMDVIQQEQRTAQSAPDNDVDMDMDTDMG